MKVRQVKVRPVRQPRPDYGLHAGRQLKALIDRLKLTIPLPCTPQEVYEALMPESLHSLWRGGEVYAELENLHIALNREYVVHVTLDDRDTWRHAMDGGGTYNRLFWISMPIAVPSPTQVLNPFRLPETSPIYGTIMEWWEQAVRLDNSLDEMQEAISHYLLYADTGPKIRATWPDLLKFVRLQGPTTGHVPAETVRRIKMETAQLITAPVRKAVTDALSTAVLLPETEVISAWVSYKM